MDKKYHPMKENSARERQVKSRKWLLWGKSIFFGKLSQPKVSKEQNKKELLQSGKH